MLVESGPVHTTCSRTHPPDHQPAPMSVAGAGSLVDTPTASDSIHRILTCTCATYIQVTTLLLRLTCVLPTACLAYPINRCGTSPHVRSGSRSLQWQYLYWQWTWEAAQVRTEVAKYDGIIPGPSAVAMCYATSGQQRVALP
jgi:hypothetical protein